jgi:arginyl-tRNA--protein-N-Asp/Glu arginylyltransferase
MSEGEEKVEPKVTSIKTYVRGNFLYSEDGFDYQEKYKDGGESMEKIVEDRIGITDLKKEIAMKKQEMKRKKESKNDKPVLIPIRDTPVEPVPEPINDNQKCERATQDQFEYFQSYISQKEKERKFDEEEQLRLDMFVLQQQVHKQKQEEMVTPARGLSVVMEKEETKPKKKSLMRIKIKKKGDQEGEDYEEKSKVRVLE